MSEKAAEEAEIRDRCLTEFFTRYDRGQAIREALPAILHDLLRARLEELVKGMPLSDGGLRLSGDVAQRVAVLTRMRQLESRRPRASGRLGGRGVGCPAA